jgi:hypothetical protein
MGSGGGGLFVPKKNIKNKEGNMRKGERRVDHQVIN